MRHNKKGRKFGRAKDQRKAFLKSLAVNLIMHGKIKTTLPRAKETSRLVDGLITKAKKENLAGIRAVQRLLPPIALKKLIKEIAPRYKERHGGYARIIKIGSRANDCAEMAFIELIK